MPTPATATRLAGQLIELCAKGGFNLTKFMSNDRNVLAQIPAEERAVPASHLDLDEQCLLTELLKWNGTSR